MASYKDAGVDIDAGNKSVKLIKGLAKKTHGPMVLNDIGAFGAAYSLKEVCKMHDPVLISTIDGVGTKLKVASAIGKWDSVGEDIVNHCSDDILGLGARPLFFLDYLAADRLVPEQIASIVGGMSKACQEVGCALIGGETAEMPGVYAKGEHDIAGCMIGVVEREEMIDGSKISKGDALIGLASNGLHTNGYSLARKVLFEDAKLSPNGKVLGLKGTIGDELLAVHRSYSKNVLALAKKIRIKGIAHITGGGLEENLGRILPGGVVAKINYSSIKVPAIFSLIKEKGGISEKEMFRVFNMGVGLVIVVNSSDVKNAIASLGAAGERAWALGSIE
ncbi:MAG: phosphoribosylformylglycinamidine cyclo-ligase [archaeon]|nr:phosphoribosylformylglycinamidine cyclo-ligase [archaeon]